MQSYLPPHHLGRVISALRYRNVDTAFRRQYRWRRADVPCPSGAFFVVPSLLWDRSAPAALDPSDSLFKPSVRAVAVQPGLVIEPRSVAWGYFQRGRRRFGTLSVTQINRRWHLPLVLVASPQASHSVAIKVSNESRAAKIAFDLRWFPLQFRPFCSVLCAVLLARCCNQLIGSTYPLVATIPTDKVVNYQAARMFLVLAVVLSRGLLLTCAIIWLGHIWGVYTTNWIAPVFGRWVLHHLLRLPWQLFAHRRTDVRVARVERREIMRVFITATALFFCLDVLFLVLFLAVMCFDSWQLLRIRHCWRYLGFMSIVIAMVGCGDIDLTWSEQVLLESGDVIVAKRTATGKKLGEIGGPGGWQQTHMSLEIHGPLASAVQPPRWETAFVPILLDYQAEKKTWSIIATFYTCDGWYQLGHPALPYVEYQSVNGGDWTVVPLEKRLVGKKSNLMIDVNSDGEPRFIYLRKL